MRYDSIIIGAGVIGCHIARRLSYYQANVLVVEKHLDVCEETSKANSGIVHSGYDATPGSLKAIYNVRGNQMMASVCKELEVAYRNNGSLIVAFDDDEMLILAKLMEKGIQNGVVGLRILGLEELRTMEPNLHSSIVGALYAPTGGIVDPFQLTIAAAEVAHKNGVPFAFQTKVEAITRYADFFVVHTSQRDYETKTLINAAGVYADEINNLLSQRKLTIHPRKGEYLLFDKQVGNLVSATIFQLPTSKGKGVLVTPTAEGNLLIGPSSEFVRDKEDTSSTKEGIQYILEKAASTVDTIPLPYLITGFAGLRAAEINEDFIIGEAPDVPGLFNVAGIESPGLTGAPAIAEDIANMVAQKLALKKKSDYQTTRKSAIRFESQTTEQKKALIEANRDYGKIICRCELVTLAEIKSAIHSPLGATTIDGIKRRTRAGGGRCQGGFCSPRVMDILAKESNKTLKEIVKSSETSTFLIGLDKELL